MMAACIVWGCPRVVAAGVVERGGAMCDRHASPTWPLDVDGVGDPYTYPESSDLAYCMAEGLTLAEVAALTA